MLQESLGDHDHINSVFEDIALSEDKFTDQGFNEEGSPGRWQQLPLRGREREHLGRDRVREVGTEIVSYEGFLESTTAREQEEGEK